MSGYGVDYVQGLGQASGFVDGSVPVAGSGYYYLVKPACAAGSWQSSPGAEPGRDAALP